MESRFSAYCPECNDEVEVTYISESDTWEHSLCGMEFYRDDVFDISTEIGDDPDEDLSFLANLA